VQQDLSPENEPQPLPAVGQLPWVDRQPVWLRLIFLFGLLVAFLVAIKLMGGSVKMLGKDTAESLFQGIANPFAALAVGILATVLVQSSSVTTSLVVGLVGSGEMTVGAAVPMIMGANIGTSITNTLVSMGHITRGAEFRRAFAGATMHDFFNLMAVVVLLPLELLTGGLQKGAEWLTGVLTFGGMEYKSPVKVFIGEIAGFFKAIVTDVMSLSGWAAAIVMLLMALSLIVFALMWITRIMRGLIAARIERALNQVLGKSAILGMAVGALMTVAVQSSSITTSLLVPLIGAGILQLQVAFPITLGANVGTTITALLAALAADKSSGLTIALVHLLFNITGIVLVYVIPGMRNVPILLAQRLALAAQRNKFWIPAYVVGVFVLMPILGILLFG
jgi:sodium-dependent phosphate cotransporter